MIAWEAAVKYQDTYHPYNYAAQLTLSHLGAHRQNKPFLLTWVETAWRAGLL